MKQLLVDFIKSSFCPDSHLTPRESLPVSTFVSFRLFKNCMQHQMLSHQIPPTADNAGECPPPCSTAPFPWAVTYTNSKMSQFIQTDNSIFTKNLQELIARRDFHFAPRAQRELPELLQHPSINRAMSIVRWRSNFQQCDQCHTNSSQIMLMSPEQNIAPEPTCRTTLTLRQSTRILFQGKQPLLCDLARIFSFRVSSLISNPCHIFPHLPKDWQREGHG